MNFWECDLGEELGRLQLKYIIWNSQTINKNILIPSEAIELVKIYFLQSLAEHVQLPEN